MFGRLCDKPTAWIQTKPTLSWRNSEVAGAAVSGRVTNRGKFVWSPQKSKSRLPLKQAPLSLDSCQAGSRNCPAFYASEFSSQIRSRYSKSRSATANAK